MKHDYLPCFRIFLSWCTEEQAGPAEPARKQAYNANHRSIRVRAEHALARLKTYTILRDYRRVCQHLGGHRLRHRTSAQPRSG